MAMRTIPRVAPAGFIVPGALVEKKRHNKLPKALLNDRGQNKLTYSAIHVEDRHGEEWPKKPGWRGNTTGWLTYREYNVIEFVQRFDMNNVYTIGDRLGIKPSTAERMYQNYIACGLIEGPMVDFKITPMALILFDMTDQYILELDLSEEDVA